MKRKTTFRRVYSFGEFCLLFPLCSAEEQARLTAIMRDQPRPDMLCGVPVPKDLNLASYGTLDDLAHLARGGNSAMVDCLAALLNVEQAQIIEANACDVYGAAQWLGREVERINGLFARIAPKYSAEEIQAGVKSLDFGSFGVLDWYAKRQGIADQNAVRDVAWVRIYTCMKNDNARAEYEKRLNRVYQNKYKSNGNRK